MKLRSYLLIIVATALLPMVVLALMLIYRITSAERDLIEQGMQETVGALADALDAELRTTVAALESLVAGPAEVNDPARLYRWTASVEARHPTWSAVMLIDRSGQQLFNTAQPFGAPLPPTNDVETIRATFASGQPQVSNLFVGPVLKTSAVAVYVPVRRGGEIEYVLGAGMTPNNWTRLLEKQHVPRGWVAGVVDRTGVIIARTRGAERFPGKSVPEWVRAAINKAAEGQGEGPGLEGQPLSLAFERSTVSGWTVFFAAPTAVFEKPLHRSLGIAVSGSLLLFVIAAGLALLAARRITAQIALLATAASTLAQQANLPALPAGRGVEEVETLHQTLSIAAQQIAEKIAVERRFQLFVACVADHAIYMLDPDGCVSSWNAGAERIAGYSAEEILGQSFARFFTEEDRATGKPAGALETARRTGRFEEEGWRLRKDGSRLWAVSVLDAVHDEQGMLIGFAEVTRDMTERRAAQQALDAAREQLFQAQKLDALGQLTGGVAHDFNNILTVVIGYLDLLAQRLEGRERAAAAAALRAAERAVGLTKRLLSFGRRQMLNPCATNVNCLIEQMREMLSRTLGEQVAIRAILAADVWPCFIDPNELEAALLNLAINARDAMPVGGTLTIETTNAHLDTGCATPYDNIVPGDYTLISVSDTGLGIPRENLSKVLEPFFTTKEVGAGSGLGLPQVYGFARQSGGYVTICSEVGIGTTVRLYLPRHSAEESAFLEEVPSEAPRARDSESVLVVEDNPTVQSFAIQCFRDLGYRIFEAEDAPRALQLLKVHPEIDLLFTDIGLPGMNGAQLAVEAVRHRPDLKVVYTTGYAGAILPAADTLQTEIAVLAKPFTRDKLAISARQALDQSLRYRVRWPA